MQKSPALELAEAVTAEIKSVAQSRGLTTTDVGDMINRSQSYVAARFREESDKHFTLTDVAHWCHLWGTDDIGQWINEALAKQRDWNNRMLPIVQAHLEEARLQRETFGATLMLDEDEG